MVFLVVIHGCGSWTIKKAECQKYWCFQTVVLKKTLESPLDCKEIEPVNPKGNQPWIFIGRTDAEAPILWPPDAKNWLTGKDPDAGKDWRQEEKGDEMVGWHHWLNGHEFEQTPGVGEGQGSLACCSPRGHKEFDMTEWLNWTESSSQLRLWDSILFSRVYYILEYSRILDHILYTFLGWGKGERRGGRKCWCS